MGDVGASEVEVWSDEEERLATGLQSIVSADGRVDRAALATLPAVSPARLRELHRTMLRLRALDVATRALVDAGRLGPVAGTGGTEAVVVGATAALGPDDVIAPGRRQSGAALVRGLPLGALAAQLHGNANDLGRGRQMPGCAAFPRALNMLPASPHPATQLPHATGIAWAMKMQGKATVALCFLDGAETSAEDFHAGLNFAGVYKVPVIFVCTTERAAAAAAAVPETLSETYAIKALAYGVPGVRVDGDDLLAVVAATRAAADRARKGEGPTFIEAVVDRGDALERLAGWLAAEKILPAADGATLAAEVDAEVQAALAAEERVGPPPRHSLIEDVFAHPPAALEAALAGLVPPKA
jgi:TPP-dependent pyruvate/acetoin dehydrogenase alpha subunit